MSDSEVEETKEMIYRFKIVKFIKRGKKGLKKEIYIVSATWIRWNNKTKRLKVPFLSTLHTNEYIDLFRHTVKSESEAPESWPVYNVNIIGESRTYTDAVERLLFLERTETAFSQNLEDNDAEKIKRAETVYKHKRLKKKNEEEIIKLFSGVPLLQKETYNCLDRSNSKTKSLKEKSKSDASSKTHKRLNVLSSDSAIWSKLQKMFEKETSKINIKLDTLSTNVESLMQDMEVVMNKILDQVQSNKSANLDNNIYLKKLYSVNTFAIM